MSVDGRKFSLAGGPRVASGRLGKAVWQFREDGWLQCHFTYTATGANDVLGVLLDYPERLVQRKRWLGDGPYRVWKNRLGGGTLGIWENDYNNTITGHSGWVYPEFKGFFTNVRWPQLETTKCLIGRISVSRRAMAMRAKSEARKNGGRGGIATPRALLPVRAGQAPRGRGARHSAFGFVSVFDFRTSGFRLRRLARNGDAPGLITVVPENIQFVQALTSGFPPTNIVGHAHASVPKAGLGFLHAIPPIGSKFKPASATGPQGQPNIGQGEYSGTVNFHFGPLS